MLRLLAFDNDDDRALWGNYAARLPPDRLDVHFLPEMMAPYEACDMGKGSLMALEDDNGFIIQPLLKCRDGVTRHAYNFGGPVSNHEKGLWGASYECTLNPFMYDHQAKLLGDRCEHVKDVVWVDLTQEPRFRSTTRHIVTKAERKMLRLQQVKPTLDEVCLFHSMYEDTMLRNQAASHWTLSSLWFYTLLEAMGDKASLHFVFADNAPVGACILVHGYGTCYYHFAASWGKDPPFGANQFMVAAAINWAKANGYERFHLGGGVNGEDGLFMFKAGFSDLRAPLYRFKQEVACAV